MTDRMVQVQHHTNSFLSHSFAPSSLVGNFANNFSWNPQNRSVQRHSSSFDISDRILDVLQPLLNELPVQQARKLQDELAETNNDQNDDGCVCDPLPPVIEIPLTVHLWSQGSQCWPPSHAIYICTTTSTTTTTTRYLTYRISEEVAKLNTS